MLIDLCQYLQRATGFGSTTPAVYTACQIPFKLTRRVISLINVGANLLSLKDLWQHKKLISHTVITWVWTFTCTGTPDINACNFPLNLLVYNEYLYNLIPQSLF